MKGHELYWTFGDQTYLMSQSQRGAGALRPYSAADELLLNWVSDFEEDSLHLIHDRYGALTTVLGPQRIGGFVRSFHSQERKVQHHLRLNNKVPLPESVWMSPLKVPDSWQIALGRLPKSIDLFELYLSGLATAAMPGNRAAFGFMTRYFSKGMLEVAEKYARKVEQSRASKKARLLLLSDFVTAETRPDELMRSWKYKGKIYRQYYGVFSAAHIDQASRFLLESWQNGKVVPGTFKPQRALDFGCGNGILTDQLSSIYPQATWVAMDDFYPALASAQLNLKNLPVHVQAGNPDEISGEYSLIVTNPPFHIEHGQSIHVSLELFAHAAQHLQDTGYLVIVANQHLNYTPHLRKYFGEVEIAASSGRFNIYRCSHPQKNNR